MAKKKATKKAGKKKTAKKAATKTAGKKTAGKKTAKKASARTGKTTSGARGKTRTAGADIDMRPPQGVKKALERGLELRKDHGGKGLVPNTITWARKLAKGAPITPQKARKMHAYFSRHKVDRKPGWDNPPTPGYVAWLLWGGDAGNTWSAALVKKLDKRDA